MTKHCSGSGWINIQVIYYKESMLQDLIQPPPTFPPASVLFTKKTVLWPCDREVSVELRGRWRSGSVRLGALSGLQWGEKQEFSPSGSSNSRGTSWEEASQTPSLQFPQLQHVPRLRVWLWVNKSSLVGHEKCFHRVPARTWPQFIFFLDTKSVSRENLPVSWPQLVLLLDMKRVSTENLPVSWPQLVLLLEQKEFPQIIFLDLGLSWFSCWTWKVFPHRIWFLASVGTDLTGSMFRAQES